VAAERKVNRHTSDGALNQSFQLEGFYGLTKATTSIFPGIRSAKGKNAVIEALSYLVVAASNRTQEISGEFRLAYRWLQPLDEQIQYYLQLRSDASRTLFQYKMSLKEDFDSNTR